MNMMEKAPAPTDIEAVLGVGKRRRQRPVLPWLLFVSGLIAAGYYLFAPRTEVLVQYASSPAVKGNLTVTVTATGTIFPTNQVDVSSELSGIIRKVNVDYNDTVQAGQVLAELDTVTLSALVERSRASLSSAKARVAQAQATAGERARNFQRQTTLAATKINTENTMDLAKADSERANAALDSARADERVADAELKQNEINLAKTRLYSPVNGIVLKRTVEVGQTVASSFQAPVLFTLAEDLQRIELRVDVDEADVGKVREDQSGAFTVEAYPGRKFPARIQQVRFASETVNNVVTYKGVLRADNPGMNLRPGMTATCEIIVEEVKDAVLIPNAALRFVPPAPKKEKSGGFTLFRMPRMQASAPPVDTSTNKRRVYVLRDGQAVPTDIVVGSSDKKMTRVIEGLDAGTPLITEIEEPAK